MYIRSSGYGQNDKKGSRYVMASVMVMVKDKHPGQDCVFGKQIDLRAILQDSDGGQGSEEGGW